MKKSKIELKKAEAEKEKILTAARRYIFTQGFNSLTVGKLATKLGLSTKVIYTHFHGKQLLLEEAIEWKFADMDREMTAAEGGGSNFSERIHAVFDVLREHAKEINAAYIHDLLEANPVFFEWTRSKRRELFTKHFEILFADGRREGAICDEVTVEVFIEMYQMLTDGILMGNTIRKQEEATVAKIYGQIVRVLSKGILRQIN